jgi:hypothetical protein
MEGQEMDWKRLVQFALLGNSDLEQYAILLVRVSIGLFFAISGANKLFVAGGTKPVYDTLVQAKVPFPQQMAYSDCLIVIHISLFHEKAARNYDPTLGKRPPRQVFLQCHSSDRIGCDGAITPEVLRGVNWTMVLAIPCPCGIKYAPLCAHMSNPYFGGGRYVRPIDSSS